MQRGPGSPPHIKYAPSGFLQRQAAEARSGDERLGALLSEVKTIKYICTVK